MAENDNKLVREVINSKNVLELATEIKNQYPQFNLDVFTEYIFNELPNLGFKERILLVREQLYEHLPKNYEQTVAIIHNSLNAELESDLDFSQANFIHLSLCQYVSSYGLKKEHLNISLNLLYELTKRFSAEFDIRYFLLEHETETIEYLHKLCSDSSSHARRLASEGSRPRLPWGIQLKKYVKDPSPIIPILQKLKNDPSEYVRRSVANSLNDISKDHPTLVCNLLNQWFVSEKSISLKTTKHALRTLIKKGNTDALKIIGINSNITFNATLNLNSNIVKLNNYLEFTIELKNTNSEEKEFLVDYKIYYLKKNQSYTQKVFKLKRLEIEANKTVSIPSKLMFKNMTTRTLYSGIHKIAILVNGTEVDEKLFEII